MSPDVAVLAAPPAQFEVIGERIMRFLGPVRSSVVEGFSFGLQWPPGGPWMSRREETLT